MTSEGPALNLDLFNVYQEAAASTAIFPPEHGLQYCALKLCGEAGEHAEKVAKLYYRGDYQGKTLAEIEEARQGCIDELGDTLWYLANLARLYGVSLSEVAARNIKKLQDRKARGVLKGSGDKR